MLKTKKGQSLEGKRPSPVLFSQQAARAKVQQRMAQISAQARADARAQALRVQPRDDNRQSLVSAG